MSTRIDVRNFSGSIEILPCGRILMSTIDGSPAADVLFVPPAIQEIEQQEYQEKMLKPVLHPGEEAYYQKNTVPQDSARGYFRMPDGTKHRILSDFDSMSPNDRREWKRENVPMKSDDNRFDRAIRLFRNPERALEKERESSRNSYRNRMAAMA